VSGLRLGVRDYKRPRRGGLGVDAAQLRGFVLGLVVGLAVAGIVYVRDHRVRTAAAATLRPVPRQRAPDDVGLQPARAAPDADAAQGSAPRSAPGGAAQDSAADQAAAAGGAGAHGATTPAAATTVGRFDFYQMLPRAQVLVPAHEHLTHVQPGAPVQQPGTYFLQIGSYRDAAVAEHVRAEVARLGISATVESISVGSGVWHRVRVGPVRELSALNRLRRQLQAARFDSLVVRVQD
jgi:cell division protein FtsN